MTEIIAVVNHKGGVGKTTTAVNVAAYLAAAGEKVLLIDLDPQGHATATCGVDKRETTEGVLSVMLGEKKPDEVCLFREDSKLYLLPTDRDLTGSDDALILKEQRNVLLKRELAGWVNQFDWVLIDCPPTLNLLMTNALVLANFVVVPVQCEYFALEAIRELRVTIRDTRRILNPSLQHLGFIRTMVDVRNRLAKEVSDQIEERYGANNLFKNFIPRNVALAEAPSHCQNILQYNKSSKGALAYQAVTRELKERVSQRRNS